MNRTRQHTKAAKARKDWQKLQEEKIEEVAKKSKVPILKKVKNTTKENTLRDSA